MLWLFENVKNKLEIVKVLIKLQIYNFTFKISKATTLKITRINLDQWFLFRAWVFSETFFYAYFFPFDALSYGSGSPSNSESWISF